MQYSTKFKHENIVETYDCFLDIYDNEFVSIMELCEDASLGD